MFQISEHVRLLTISGERHGTYESFAMLRLRATGEAGELCSVICVWFFKVQPLYYLEGGVLVRSSADVCMVCIHFDLTISVLSSHCELSMLLRTTYLLSLGWWCFAYSSNEGICDNKSARLMDRCRGCLFTFSRNVKRRVLGMTSGMYLSLSIRLSHEFEIEDVMFPIIKWKQLWWIIFLTAHDEVYYDSAT